MRVLFDLGTISFSDNLNILGYAMPSGLKLRQEHLDSTVAATYGWSDYTPDMPDTAILGRLLALNLERSNR